MRTVRGAAIANRALMLENRGEAEAIAIRFFSSGQGAKLTPMRPKQPE